MGLPAVEIVIVGGETVESLVEMIEPMVRPAEPPQ